MIQVNIYCIRAYGIRSVRGRKIYRNFINIIPFVFTRNPDMLRMETDKHLENIHKINPQLLFFSNYNSFY